MSDHEMRPRGGVVSGPRNDRARTIGTIVGGIAGAAVAIVDILQEDTPVPIPVLLLGALVGMVWGAHAGRAIGGKVGDLLPEEESPCPSQDEELAI
jgi:hypothetical protein